MLGVVHVKCYGFRFVRCRRVIRRGHATFTIQLYTYTPAYNQIIVTFHPFIAKTAGIVEEVHILCRVQVDLQPR